MQKTTLAKKGEISRDWVLIDLDGKVLGRTASKIANILRGKNKTMYTPHQDTGDFVVAINASKIKLTGAKLENKTYYEHSGYVGGIKETLAGDFLKKDSTELLRRAVYGMLPGNGMRKHLMKKLRIFAGDKHPHNAQQPKPIKT